MDQFDRPVNGSGSSIEDPAAPRLCTRRRWRISGGERWRAAARDNERRREAGVGLGCPI
jgi:hypothetical protein